MAKKKTQKSKTPNNSNHKKNTDVVQPKAIQKTEEKPQTQGKEQPKNNTFKK